MSQSGKIFVFQIQGSDLYHSTSFQLHNKILMMYLFHHTIKSEVIFVSVISNLSGVSQKAFLISLFQSICNVHV
jgi:hypothetical protein